MQNKALIYRRFGCPEDVLRLETCQVCDAAPGRVQIRMEMAPVNPSDLIPITGAYAHRIGLPEVAGYEGVGTVVSSDDGSRFIFGQRVLPLRGTGTWQRIVECNPEWVVAVPGDLSEEVAARGYINPLAALLMLKNWSPSGRRLLLTGAGSSCARLLAQWALEAGAKSVHGVCRSSAHLASLEALGVSAITIDNWAWVEALARSSDLVFDAVGGALASFILRNLRVHASFVSYGLLSGEAIDLIRGGQRIERFHIRDQLGPVDSVIWTEWFDEIWRRLKHTRLPDVEHFTLDHWQDALRHFRAYGRNTKTVLVID